MSGTLHVICSHSNRVVICVGLYVCMFARTKKKVKNVKKAAKFIVCYFQVSFWCRTVEYSVTVICDWVLFHSNLIYINSSIGIPFTTVLSTKKTTILRISFSLSLSPPLPPSLKHKHTLILHLSNPRCITFSTKIT